MATTTQCTECGAAPGTHEIYGEDDQAYLVCLECATAQYEKEEREDIEGRTCDDCQFRPAERIFCHMDKGTFYLCERCWGWADHEDDYLDYCDCEWPYGEPMDSECLKCRRSLREPKTHCECETPTVTELQQHNCRECGGRIPYKHAGDFNVIEDTK
jgi:hypothetical protein